MLKGPIIVTAGPTYEPIDAVRFIGNRSSGRMGIAIAIAACESGHEVILMLGPGTVDPPPASDGFDIVRFGSCADLEACLATHWPSRANTLIMAAAVSDFRPHQAGAEKQQKLRRTADGMTLSLESTPDLVAQCASRRRRDEDQTIVAFALEPEAELDARAGAKLQRKRVDAIVANPLETMDAASIQGASIIWSNGRSVRMPSPSMSKPEFARWLLKTL